MEQALADPSVTAIVLTGRGKAFCAGAEIKEFNTPAAFAEPTLGHGDRVHRELAEAGRGRDQRHRDGRRPRARARLPLPRRGAGRADRAARGQARHSARRRRHAAAAARDRRRAGAQHDRQRHAVPSDKLAPTALFNRMVDSHDDLVGRAVAFAKEIADRLPPPKIRDIRIDFPLHEAFFAFARNTVERGREELSGAEEVRRRRRGRRHEALRRRPRSSSARASSSSCRRRSRRRCATRSSASARPRRSPTCRTTRRRAPIRSAAVIGAGTMGGGIAMNFANAGIPVKVLETEAGGARPGPRRRSARTTRTR